MFENYIELSTDKIVNLFEKDAFPIHLNEVFSHPSIGKAYKSYISAEVDWWIYEDLVQRSQTQNLDFDDSEVDPVINELDNQYKQKVEFDLEEYRKIINTAVKSRVNLLCRPRFTLKRFVFRGELVRPFNEIVKRLNYFSDYTYLADGFLELASITGDESISEEIMAAGRFENLISKTDKEYILNFSPAEFVELLDPMFEFFNDIDDEEEDKSVPVDALIIFLDDKGIAPLAKALEKEMDKGLSKVSQKILIDFINDFVDSFEKVTEELVAKIDQTEMKEEIESVDVESFDNELVISLEEITGTLENSKQSDDFESIEEYEQSVEMKDSDDEFILNVKSELVEFTKEVIDFADRIVEEVVVDNHSVDEEESVETEAEKDDIQKNIDAIEEIIGIAGNEEEIYMETDLEIPEESGPEIEIPNETIELYEKVFGLSGTKIEEDNENTNAAEILKAELTGNLIEAPTVDEDNTLPVE